MGKVIIFSAPSGSGKTTIVRELLKRFPQFEFSDMKHPSCKKRPIGVFSRSFQMVVHLESIKDLAIFY